MRGFAWAQERKAGCISIRYVPFLVRSGHDAEILHFVRKNPPSDPESGGRPGFIPIAFLQRGQNHSAFELLHRLDKVIRLARITPWKLRWEAVLPCCAKPPAAGEKAGFPLDHKLSKRARLHSAIRAHCPARCGRITSRWPPQKWLRRDTCASGLPL